MYYSLTFSSFLSESCNYLMTVIFFFVNTINDSRSVWNGHNINCNDEHFTYSVSRPGQVTYFVLCCFAGPVWHHCGQWDYGSFSSHHRSGGHEAETRKNGGGHQSQWAARHHRGFGALLSHVSVYLTLKCVNVLTVMFVSQGVCGALTVLMRDAIKPNLMQTLEVTVMFWVMCTIFKLRCESPRVTQALKTS